MAASEYAVVVQELGVNQGFVAARARLAKKGLTIPRLELVSRYMAVSLLKNVTEALKGFILTARYFWLDSTLALYWMRRSIVLDQVSRRIQTVR